MVIIFIRFCEGSSKNLSLGSLIRTQKLLISCQSGEIVILSFTQFSTVQENWLVIFIAEGLYCIEAPVYISLPRQGHLLIYISVGDRVAEGFYFPHATTIKPSSP